MNKFIPVSYMVHKFIPSTLNIKFQFYTAPKMPTTVEQTQVHLHACYHSVNNKTPNSSLYTFINYDNKVWLLPKAHLAVHLHRHCRACSRASSTLHEF